MIASSLIVIMIISWLLYQNQIKVHETKIRVDGVAITRALSGADYHQLLTETNKNNLMKTLVDVQVNEDFAYGVVVNLAGKKLFETTSAGSIAPAAEMPTEPFAWFGEHNVISPGDARKIREFFAPVMSSGELAGFVRVGYYDKPAGMMDSTISDLALMALPIFLLTVLSYFLIRREIKPLAKLSEKMEEASLSYGLQPVSHVSGVDLGDFIQRFDQFIQLVQTRTQEKSRKSFSEKTANHLLIYKQEKSESALNSFPDGLIMLDSACVPNFANYKVESLLGASREQIIDHPPQEWCHNKEVLAFLNKLKNPTSTMRMPSIEYMPEVNSEKRVLAAAFPLVSPRDQGTLFGTMVLFRDISQEYTAKQSGSEFVSHVSHELKTPLNTLSAYSELLLDYATLEEADRVNAVNVIHGEVERMSGLINNLLNISKIEAGNLQLNRKRVKLNDLLLDSFNSMQDHALSKGVKLELKIPPELGSMRLDKGLFRIAVDNLLSNAIKYSNEGTSVVMEVQILEDEQIQLVVRDQGIGISAEDCEKIFRKYYRAENSETESCSGHGLGLFLAKQIVELHQGSIKVDSILGKGTEFTLTFKAQPVQLEESQT